MPCPEVFAKVQSATRVQPEVNEAVKSATLVQPKKKGEAF